MTARLSPEAAKPDPINPPMSAWLELEGSPNHQVTRFQTIAPIRAQMSICEPIPDGMSLESSNPELMVFATAVP